MVADSTHDGGFDIRIIENRQGFDALRGPWSALDAQPGVRPFQEFGWSAAWVHTIGAAGGWDLRVGTAWRADRLIAVLPLCVRRYKGVRMLEWIGARVTDYCDAVVDSMIDPDHVLPLLWKTIARRGGFDVARLNHVRTDAKVFRTLSSLNPWTETFEQAGGVPIKWSTGMQWLEQQSAGMRDRVKYNARRMARSGFEARQQTPQEPCAPILEVLIAQKRSWLAARGLTTFLDEPGGVEFLVSAVEAAASRGELHLTSVQARDGRIAAVDLTFVREGTAYSYLASFDPDLAKYSFGRILTDNLLMWLCDSGWKRLDLLLGAYDYKNEYGCDLEPVRTLVIPRGIVGYAAVSLYRRKVESAARRASQLEKVACGAFSDIGSVAAGKKRGFCRLRGTINASPTGS